MSIKFNAVRVILVTATAVLVLFFVAVRIDPLPQGLAATYYSDANWSSAPVREIVESQPTTDRLAAAWPGTPPEIFSVAWTGSLIVTHAGTYVFEIESDDGSWLYLDGRLVAENGGVHAVQSRQGSVRLDRGVHEIFVRYMQNGGPFAFDLRWAETGAQPSRIPAWALWARHAEFPRVLISALLRRSLPIVFALWCALLVIAAGAALAGPLRRFAAWLWIDPVRRAVACVVAGSALLNIAGIWWGVPSAWAGDELTPKGVLIALSRHFSSGWFDRYPPLHFYVLTVAYSPVLAADALGWLHLSDPQQVSLLMLIGRLVSVVAAAGTIVAVYACGAQVFGRRAGVWAAAAMAVVPMFVFYAKTANPEAAYVFWFATALAFYLRAIDSGEVRDVVIFCACAAMSICTKDQAYALFISMPFVLMYRWRVIADRRLIIGGAAAALVFIAVQNIALNAQGFLGHVRDITGPGSNYRMFPQSLGGHVSLLALTVRLDVSSWGWPMFVASAAGLVIALRDARLRASAVVVALVAGTYYAGFIAVVGYDYDRYLLPICVVQALCAGVALEWIAAASTADTWRRVAAGAVVGYSILYGATVDALMIRDSRYDAERWLQAHAGSQRLVATTFPDVVNPRMGAFRSVDIDTRQDLQKWDPEYFVLDADYARAIAPHRPEAALVAGLHDGTLGYRLAYRRRTPSPWPWLPLGHPDLVGPRLTFPVVSFLRDLSPTIEIYERAPSS